MNKKKILSILLSLMLVLSLSLILVACGGDGDNDGDGNGAQACASCVDADRDLKCDVCQGAVACTDHRDENADFYCDFCNDDFTKICRNHINENTNGRCDICGKKMKIDITLFVTDQYGNPMAGVGLIADNNDDEPYEVVTNAEGKVRLNLFDGSYRITFDATTVPDGYLAYAKTTTIDTKEQVVKLEMVNNIPNGEAGRPFVVDSDTESETLPASGRYYYIIYHASSRFLKLDGENFVVVYNGNEYMPEGGTVTIALEEIETNDQTYFYIQNLSTEENTIAVDLYALPGTQSNPYVVDELGELEITVEAEDQNIYYTYTATESGTLNISFADTSLVVRVTNGSTSNQIVVNADNVGEISVSEGDVISIVVNASVKATYLINFEIV